MKEILFFAIIVFLLPAVFFVPIADTLTRDGRRGAMPLAIIIMALIVVLLLMLGKGSIW